MGIFRENKKRNIMITSVCGVIIVAGGVCAGILLWPKDEHTTSVPAIDINDKEALNKLNEILNPDANKDTSSDGPLYTVIPCEEAARVTGESCQSETQTPTYPTYNPNYTTPEPTPEPTPTPYNVPSVDPAPSYTPTCEDYHAQYYAEYNSQLHEINSRYTSAINSAAANCGSFGGCPQKSSLEQQWKSETVTLKNRYRTNMSNAGCNPDEYVSL